MFSLFSTSKDPSQACKKRNQEPLKTEEDLFLFGKRESDNFLRTGVFLSEGNSFLATSTLPTSATLSFLLFSVPRGFTLCALPPIIHFRRDSLAEGLVWRILDNALGCRHSKTANRKPELVSR